MRNTTSKTAPEPIDLRQFRLRYGAAALTELGRLAGLKDNYIYQLAGGHKSVTLEMAKRLREVAPELGIIELMEMRGKILAEKRQMATV